MSEENKRQIRRIVEVFASGDTSDLEALIAPTYIDQEDPSMPESHGPERFRAVVEAAHAFGSPSVVVEDLIGEGDRVAVRLRWRWSEPLDERETLDIVRFEGGLAVEHWGASTQS
jgi:predicted SnoaL-like aldol condensation-catalyzing enzyme